MHPRERRDRIAHPRTIGLLLMLATLALALSPAAAGANDDYTLDPQYVTYATASITPAQGLPGTAISVTITFWPSNACGWTAVALRTAPGPGPDSKIVSIGFTTLQQNGSYVGVVHVPEAAVAGTVYWADGGCIAGPVISPPQPFLVTAPEVRAKT